MALGDPTRIPTRIWGSGSETWRRSLPHLQLQVPLGVRTACVSQSGRQGAEGGHIYRVSEPAGQVRSAFISQHHQPAVGWLFLVPEEPWKDISLGICSQSHILSLFLGDSPYDPLTSLGLTGNHVQSK